MPKNKAFSTNVKDYPAGMSLWEKESLAAEAVLAAQRKAKKKRDEAKLVKKQKQMRRQKENTK
jgi:hypothetical protein